MTAGLHEKALCDVVQKMEENMSELTDKPQESAVCGADKAPALVKSDWVIMLCLYLGTLTIHVLMTLCTTIFNLTPDEYSVTAVAAYANGYDWQSTVSTGGYYGYFQSIFYIPVFWMTDDPYMRYRIMLWINGALMSFAPTIVYYLSRKTFGVKRGASTAFSLVCGLYPCYMLLTKYTWNETMCNLLPWVFVLIMYKSLDSKTTLTKQIFSVLGGLTLIAAYATHGRMLALLAAGIALEVIVFFSMKKKRIFCFTGFFGSIAVGLVADKCIKNLVQSALWKVDEGQTPTNTIEKMFTRIFSTGDGGIGLSDGVSLERFAQTLVGHLFYFISSTWGFGAICVVAVITAIVLYYRRRGSSPVMDGDGRPNPKKGPYIDDSSAVFMWFTLLVMGAIFVVSVAFKATSSLFEERMDTVMYGRYTEVMYPIAIFAGLLLLYKNRVGLGQSFGALIFASAVNLLTMLCVVPVVLGGERFVSAMILGLAPLRYGEGIKDLFTQESFVKIIATTMIMLFVWVIIKLIRQNDRTIHWFYTIPLAGLLLYTNVYDYVNYTIPQSKNAISGANYMSEAIDLLDGEFDSVVCLNIARERYVKAQFLYPDLDITIVSSYTKLKNLDEPADIILAGKEENLNLWLDDVYLIGSINNTVQVYAGTQEAVEWAEEKGLKVSENGIISYSAAEIPTTTHAVRVGVDESADENYEADESDGASVVLPNGAAVYTNYTTISKSGEYYFTVYGEGVGSGKITLTSDKGSNTLDYEIVEQSDNVLQIKATFAKKAENVRFKLSNTGSEPITVTRLTIDDDAADDSAAG